MSSMAMKTEPWCPSEKENMTQEPCVITNCNSNIKHANIFKIRETQPKIVKDQVW